MSGTPDIGANGRIDIRVPQSYVQTDDSVWEDLESLLYQGFLVSHADVLGQHFVFKTLNHLELRAIELSRVSSASSDETKSGFRAAFIAYSVLMANGANALWERPRHIQRLTKTFSRVPAATQEMVIGSLSALNSRSTRAYPLVEVYVHENRSRFRWAQFQDVPVNSPIVTGIAGTDLIGMNQCQLTWTALNRFVDRREEMEREWSNAKFVGSCMAGKGIRSVDESDKMRLERERTDREEKKLEVLKAYLNRTTGPKRIVDTVSLPDGRTAEVVGRFRAESAQELARQLSMALNNEKDAHDLAVEGHIQRIRDRTLELEREKREMIAAAARRPRDQVESATFRLSKEEAETRMARIRASMLETRIRAVPGSEASDTGPGKETR